MATGESTNQQTSDRFSKRPPRPQWQRRLLAGGLLLLLVLALILAPPLINANRLQRRIATSMSESLGRPVHLEDVSLHLLPVPGFTLRNLVVSEDPEFGEEPVIRAATVELRLRFSSLWHRQVECSTIRFTDGASLNLVRNPEGRWNLQSLLMAASHVESAPTAQQKPGPAPRFPYIEVVGGRVNLKLGDEKQPFSLTEADFALWQPEEQHWRVRLDAKPARTDGDVKDPGAIRLEGTLERAATMALVPVDLQASWHNAQLGEASRIVSGEDAGWRGLLNADVSLKGPLGAAKLEASFTTNELRRADFVPAHPLDLTLSCTSEANVAAVTLDRTLCSLPVSDSVNAEFKSTRVDLQRPAEADWHLEVPMFPAAGWLRIFFQNIPNDLQPMDYLFAGHLDRETGSNQPWKGNGFLHLPEKLTQKMNGARPFVLALSPVVQPAGKESSYVPEFQFLPFDMWSPDHKSLTGSAKAFTGSAITGTGKVSTAGYELRLAGAASAFTLREAQGVLPLLKSSLEAQVQSGAAPDLSHPVNLACHGTWSAEGVCDTVVAELPHGNARKKARRP